jgi:hypothetical protein
MVANLFWDSLPGDFSSWGASKTRESPLSHTAKVVCHPVWLMMDGKCWKENQRLGSVVGRSP